MRPLLIAIADRLQRLQLWLGATALIVLMAVTCTDVFMRYLFNRPVRGSYDMVESLLLVFVFNGMAATFFARRHIVIDLIDGFVGERVTAVLIRIADLLSVVCIGLLMWAMRVPAVQAFQYGDVKLELNLPIWVLWAIAFVGLAGTIFCAIVALVARPATAQTEPI